jgi:hexosaminidase
MKYTEATPLGQDWADVTDVKKAYGWDPGDQVKNVEESSVLGVEAPLVGDRGDDGGHRVSWRSRGCRPSGAGLVNAVDPRLDRVQEAAGRPGTALGGDGGIYCHSTQVPWPAGA